MRDTVLFCARMWIQKYHFYLETVITEIFKKKEEFVLCTLHLQMQKTLRNS